jgi:hypothetical protein
MVHVLLLQDLAEHGILVLVLALNQPYQTRIGVPFNP